jgi:hypothetical protein
MSCTLRPRAATTTPRSLARHGAFFMMGAARAPGRTRVTRSRARTTGAVRGRAQVPSAFSSFAPSGDPQPVHGSQPALAL